MRRRYRSKRLLLRTHGRRRRADAPGASHRNERSRIHHRVFGGHKCRRPSHDRASSRYYNVFRIIELEATVADVLAYRRIRPTSDLAHLLEVVVADVDSRRRGWNPRRKR